MSELIVDRFIRIDPKSSISAHYKSAHPPFDKPNRVNRGDYAPQYSVNDSIPLGVHALRHTSMIYSENGEESLLSEISKIGHFVIIYLIDGCIDLVDQKQKRRLKMLTGSAYSFFNHPGTRIKPSIGCSWLAFTVPEYTIRESFERLTKRPYFREFPFSSPYNIPSRIAADFYRALGTAGAELAGTTGTVREALSEAYERLLLTKLCVTSPSPRHGEKSAVMPSIAPRYLQYAEAFMRHNIDHQITLNNLATAAGCSPRALQRIFRDHRNASPMEILCNYRLAAAYKAIMDGVAQNVTDLAMQLRFSSPGRFSSLFKKAYGKSPSAMIRFPEKNL